MIINFQHAVKKHKNMPILTIKVRPSFTTPWYGHEETKNTVISVNQMPTSQGNVMFAQQEGPNWKNQVLFAISFTIMSLL